MSWLISLILAGVVFTSDTNIPPQKNNYTNNEQTKVVSLDDTERFEQTYPLSANGRVSVSNINGSITVDTWDRNEVKFEAVKTADSKERLSEVEISIDAKPDSFSVETDYGNWKRENNGWKKNNGKLTVEYRLTVPRNAILDEIETVNGSVSITNSNNTTKASTVNGQVMATNLRGTANLSTVNGTVEATFDQLQSGSRISLNTVNGQVNLMIPSDANATVKADTVNGTITNDFGLPVRKGKYVGKDLYGRIGTGDVQIKLDSVNGGLNIKRKSDGKNLNPATNLLPQKSKDDEDDEDWDDDEDSINADKMNKDIEKAVKDSEKETKNTQKELQKAQKEINKINPEIKKITEDSIKRSAEAIENSARVLSSEEYRQKIKEAQLKQKEALARIAETTFFRDSPVIEKKNESFTVKGVPKVSVDAKGCDVSVRGWDKQEVQYFVTRISKNRNRKPLEFKADHTDSEVNISVVNNNPKGKNEAFNFNFNDSSRVRVEVFVPKKSNLRIITDREIRLENVSGEIELEGQNEAINIRDVGGKLRVAAVEGGIRVIGFRGEIESTTDCGTMSLEGDFQKITATTQDGNIILTLPGEKSATIRANTDTINLDGIPPTKVKVVELSEEASVWRIGGGSGANFNFNIANGQIFVRSADELKTDF